MYKLFVITDPTNFTEIFECTDTNNMRKISKLRLPQESIEFIKNYSNSVQEEVDVTYVGPSDYIRYFISQVNELEFAKAHAMEE